MAKTNTETKAAKKTKTVKQQAAKNKTLVIVESPSKAKTINKYLGKDYIIEASMGHIIDLPKSRMAVDVNNEFTPEYITVRGRAPILNKLKRLAGSAERVLLAADPDREGEAISWHLSRALAPLNPDIKRIEFNEITESALKEAVLHPREIKMDLVNAQQARRILDRLVGYSISPLLWKKIKRGLSAGRVQSIALRLICEREKEIEAFVPEEYWTLDAKFAHKKGNMEGSLVTVNGEKADLRNEEQVKGIVSALENVPAEIRSVVKKERKRSPSAPYTTSKMQQDASTRLGYTSHKTMMVAQQLYEGIELGNDVITGLITYMRTDSVRSSPAAVEQARAHVEKTLGKEYLSPEIRSYATAKSAQDAHEAIRPTDVTRTPESVAQYLSKDQLRLYTLIWQKFVSSQMADEISDVTTIEIQAGDYGFRVNGRIIRFNGFAEVYNFDDKKKKDTKVPEVAAGEPVTIRSLEPEQHFTQPPPRFSDATMVKVLEESGVGRPSTYAPTIQTLLKRFYVVRLNKALKPTDLGILVNDVMTSHFSTLVDQDFTAGMEENLDKVSSSELNWKLMLKEFYDPFIQTVEKAVSNIEEMKNVLDEPTDYVCEKCGRKMVKKIGRHGYFLACPGFPECRNAKAIPIGPCPTCETGHVIMRATKRGRPFYGCDRYPECEFSTWDKPTGELCPECGKIMLEKSSKEKGKFTGCSSCDYEKESSKTA